MFPLRLFRIVPVFVALLAPAIQCQTAGNYDRIQLKLNSDEAAAVPAILDKRAAGNAVTDADWQRLFTSEPYIRLRKREAAMHRDFSNEEFKKFVLTPELAAKAPELRQTLDAWSHSDLVASARRVLAYLPEQASIKAQALPPVLTGLNNL